MLYQLGTVLVRKPETEDLESLYAYKNDPEVAALLGGFSTGYSRADLKEWLEFHRKRSDEVLWSIVDTESHRCVGHVGLYKIDFRVRSAEFAIMIGDRRFRGRGIGRLCTRFALEYGFRELNLNRITLTVLATNARARRLYESVGFQVEGCFRQAQIKDGVYVDIIAMAILREEYLANAHV